jgi:hypothetical protein
VVDKAIQHSIVLTEYQTIVNIDNYNTVVPNKEAFVDPALGEAS